MLKDFLIRGLKKIYSLEKCEQTELTLDYVELIDVVNFLILQFFAVYNCQNTEQLLHQLRY